MSESIVIGFGNSQGRISKKLLEEKCQVIERINLKASVTVPRVTAKRFEDIDLGIYMGLISKRRNQMLLQSFIGLNEPWEQNENLSNLRYAAQKRINEINEELSIFISVSASNDCSKFIDETKASEAEALEYLDEFKGNLQLAIRSFHQRMTIINDFAKKHKISEIEAKRTLKPNNYNPDLFEY